MLLCFSNFHNVYIVLLSVCVERKWSLNKKTLPFASSTDNGPNTKQHLLWKSLLPTFSTKSLVGTCIKMACFSVFLLGRHGKSPTHSHLWAGRSHRAPQGERQSQVLSRIWGRNADYLSLKILNLGNSSGFDAVLLIFIVDSSLFVLLFFFD